MNTSATSALDDRQLVRAVAARNKDALQELYTRHGAVLFSLALRILTDRAEAEDILQEAFAQIWKATSSFDEDRSGGLSWLIMITRSRALDRLRSGKSPARPGESVAQGTAGGTPRPPIDEAADSEAQRKVRHALQDLPQDQRLPIEMAYFGGLTQFEIAQKLGLPLGTIKTRINNGMALLRERLNHPNPPQGGTAS